MNNKVLIAFATKCGATEDAAQQIAATLRSKYRLEVDLVNLGQQAHPNFSRYDNIVVASGIRMKKWYKGAEKFLENDFQGKNTALFVCSMYEGGNPKAYPAALERLEKVSEKNLRVKPLALGVFGGRMKFMGRTNSDNLDLNRITAWAQDLGEKIRNPQIQNTSKPCDQVQI